MGFSGTNYYDDGGGDIMDGAIVLNFILAHNRSGNIPLSAEARAALLCHLPVDSDEYRALKNYINADYDNEPEYVVIHSRRIFGASYSQKEVDRWRSKIAEARAAKEKSDGL